MPWTSGLRVYAQHLAASTAPRVTRAVLAGSMVMIAACGTPGTPGTPGDGGPDVRIDAPTAAACVAADPDVFLPSECCLAEARRPLPERATTVVDLSDLAAIEVGTCGTYLFPEPPYRRGFALPSDPAAYPLKVILPAVTAVDPACAEVCMPTGDPEATAFGIALETSGLIGAREGRGLSILVPPPWKIVSGGCGEACPYPCIEGYQEFGIRTCTTMFYGDFGFATPSATPSVAAVIELIDAPASVRDLGEPGCCLYE